ncbi:MAG: hypothetical protein IJ806_07240 [Ruminococcus sp.]|nr:hypothetical protein [Ruminococcus sp.]
MKVYLVDFENVKSKGLTGINNLTEYDRVIIFYSENADTISFEMHQKVMMSKADVEYFKVHVGGKNALDFQLSTLLGYLVGSKAYTHLFIISNDKSFDFLHDFWHGKYIASPECVVYRTRTISSALTYTGAKKTAANEEEEPENDTELSESAVVIRPESAEGEELIYEAVVEKEDKIREEPEENAPERVRADGRRRGRERSERTSDRRSDRRRGDRREEHEAHDAHDKDEGARKTVSLNDSELFEMYMKGLSGSSEPAEEKNSAAEELVDKAEESNVNVPEEKTEGVPIESLALDSAAEVREDSAAAETEKKAEEKTQEPLGPENVAERRQPEKKKRQNGRRTFSLALRNAIKPAGVEEWQIRKIEEFMIQAETKEDLHNSMAKEFKQQATEFYKLLRPKFLRLKELYYQEHPEARPESDEIENKLKDVTVVSERAESEESAVSADSEGTAESAEVTETAERTDAVQEAEESAPAEEQQEEAKPAKKSRSRQSRGRKKAEEKKSAEGIDPVVAGLLEGMCSEEELSTTNELFLTAETRQKFYIRMVKAFGKGKGIQLYNAVKAEYAARSRK